MNAEQDIAGLYESWKASPTPESLSQVVKKLTPTINYSLASVRASDDPLVKAKAMSLAAEAVERYDPAGGAALPTFVSSHLRQLNRVARQSRAVTKIPDRMHAEAWQLTSARKRFYDENGREPDTAELADFTGVPVKRIEKVRRYQVAVPGEESMGDVEYAHPDYEREALEYVFQNSDHTDRRILELKTGYAGHPISDSKLAAKTLNLTPSQLSRRSARLAMRINSIVGKLNRQ